VYGPAFRQRPFEPHMRLDGTEFGNFDDSQLINGSGFPPYGYYFPGDHSGCICDFEPIIIESATEIPPAAEQPVDSYAKAGDPPEWDGEQTVALKHYQAQGFETINDQLRQGGRISGGEAPAIAQIDKAIADSPGFRNDVSLYRGVHPDLFPDDIPAGTVITDRGFISTSRSQAKAAGFARAKRGRVIEIKAPAGTKTADMSGLRTVTAGEAEELMARGSKFRFTGERYTFEGDNQFERAETWVWELMEE
jgi:hypothetical protein